MLSHDAALELAQQFLVSTSGSRPVRLVAESAVVHDGYLIARYNSVAFLDHGDAGARMVGNLPIKVNLTTEECGYCTLDELIEFVGLGIL